MNYWEVKMSKGKIFTAPEVQAIIAGNKRMFREVIKNKTSFEDFLQTREVGDNWYKDRTISMRGQGGLWGDYTLERFVEKFCPYQVGQMIFCKESFNIFAGQVAYKQNLANAERYIWKPAQQMKQEQSRLTLQIKEIRVERLADINEEDAIAEAPQYSIIQPFGNKCPIDFFKTLWNSTHKKPEEKFEANPWVWSIQFEVEK